MGLRETLNSATPGPWRFDCQPCGTLYDGVEYVTPMVDGPTERTLAGTSTVVVHEYEPVAPESECVHNARLIALAPELAALALDMGEVCKHIATWMDADAPLAIEARALLARLDQLGKEPA